MNETAIKKSLSDLNEAITALPSLGSAQPASQGLYESHASSSEPSVEESIDQLRLRVKYLLFDLEATRRENRYLRQILETRPRSDKDEPADDKQ